MKDKSDNIDSPITSKWLLFLLTLLLALTACGPSDEERRENNLRNLETGIVKVEVGGQKFDIPLRYMYGEAIVKYGRWPTPKKERLKTTDLSLSMLLPDLKPYFPEDEEKWKELGHGDRMSVSITNRGDGDWYHFVNDMTLDWVAQKENYSREKDVHGLRYYETPSGREYYPLNGQTLRITCNSKKVFSPSCRFKSNYKNGLALEGTFGVKYLPQWQDIDTGLKKLFNRFSAPERTSLNE